ncbi:MAG TPA: hypothetical protein VJ779_11170 [Acetobacteraceae bacterium]|jgi:hypothetical protein|nr:hypothetical protein [Acetobacteraceae bacterium]
MRTCALKGVEQVMTAQADRITASAAQAQEAARHSASDIINRAGEWSADKLRTAAEEAGSMILERMVDLASRSEQAARSTKIYFWGTTAIMTLGAAAVVVGAWLMRQRGMGSNQHG